MNDDPDTLWIQIMLTLLVAFVLLLLGAVVGDKTAKATGFDNCIKYHEKLSVVEANALCDKVVRGVK
jgi:hypothetical protein